MLINNIYKKYYFFNILIELNLIIFFNNVFRAKFILFIYQYIYVENFKNHIYLYLKLTQL